MTTMDSIMSVAAMVMGKLREYFPGTFMTLGYAWECILDGTLLQQLGTPMALVWSLASLALFTLLLMRVSAKDKQIAAAKAAAGAQAAHEAHP